MTNPIYTQSDRPQQNPPMRRQSNSTAWLLTGGIFVIGAVFALGLLAAGAILYFSQNSGIEDNVTVAGLSVGGMSANEAEEYLLQNISTQPVVLTDGDRNWALTLADLGISINVDATLDTVQDANSGENVQPFYTIDLNQAQTGFIALSDLANIPASSDNPPQNGRAIDIPVMLDRLRVNLNLEMADGIIDLTMIEVEPPIEETPQQNSGATTVHVVEQGQELGLIAKEYGVSVEDIVALNELANADVIHIGQ
jgi:hypothetical protein